ncbi:MAG TPA: phenylalanine--tRNA ligase subunit alpha, partial [Nitrosarchaeum sp.]|nr:phenylalanine--tRNA ligase subunit alpha [Nitrosarchaeum sp.]
MSQVFHEIEKKIIRLLIENPKLSPEKIGASSGLTPDQVRRGIEWLKLKNLANIEESKQIFLRLGKNGLEANSKGLPERQLLNLLKEKPRQLNELKKELKFIFGPAMGIARKNNWVETDGETVSLKNNPSEILEEKIISKIGTKKISLDEIEDKTTLEILKKRPDFIIEEIEKSQTISLSEQAKSIDFEAASSGAIDVEADVPKTFVAKTHPLKDTINEIREIFVTLGFSEISGNLAQPSFWNFDALFTPQDHPAREMQDTFYLDGIVSKKIATQNQIQQVSKTHKSGWRYLWNVNEARKMVLRTHTTCVTIKHLAEHKPDEARIFSLGRVFRNEKVSYKHLVEFNQVEGIVVGKNTTLRDLMGIQREFYRRIG